MRGEGGGVAGSQPMSTAVHRRSNSIFNLWFSGFNIIFIQQNLMKVDNEIVYIFSLSSSCEGEPASIVRLNKCFMASSKHFSILLYPYKCKLQG
jgi:hypothetical protein